MLLPEFTVTQKVLKNISAVEYSRAVADNVKILPAWQKQLRKEQQTSRISSLLKMEGITISDSEVKESLDNFSGPQKQEIQNLSRTALLVKEIGKKLELEEIDVKYINQNLTEKLVPKSRQGIYRSAKKTGRPGPEEILARMVTLFDWFNTLDARENHPVISAALMMAEILRIEPFEKFNFSTASLTFDLVLETFGYGFDGLIENDSFLSGSRKELEQVISNLDNNSPDYTKWLEFLTQGLSAKTYNLIEKIKLLEKDTKVAKATGRVKVSTRQERIIEYLQDYGMIQNKDFANIFPGISEDTVLRDLKQLVGMNIIKKTGSTKSSRYELS